MTGAAVGRRSARRGWLMWIGALIGLGALAWVLRRFEFDRFLALVRDADVRFLTLIALAIMAEQLVRAWKWRQLLHPLRPGMGVLRLFGAIMAGLPSRHHVPLRPRHRCPLVARGAPGGPPVRVRACNRRH